MMHRGLPTAGNEVAPHYHQLLVMRRASEASLFFFGIPREKKPLHNGSYEHRVPKNKTLFCTRDVCVIQHRNWPLRSTILNAHGTNASPDGLCTRTHTNEAFSCCFCCNSLRVDRARRGNVCYNEARPKERSHRGRFLGMPGPFLKSLDSCVYMNPTHGP